MNAIIRKACLGDVRSIHEVHMKSIQDLCCDDYLTKQINVWGRVPFDDTARTKIENTIQDNNRLMLVIEVGCMVHGYGELVCDREKKKASVVGLYITKESSRKGFGKNMLKELLEHAAGEGVIEVSLHATLTAKKFYLSQGFSVVNDNAIIKIGGLDFQTIFMKKIIA